MTKQLDTLQAISEFGSTIVFLTEEKTVYNLHNLLYKEATHIIQNTQVMECRKVSKIHNNQDTFEVKPTVKEFMEHLMADVSPSSVYPLNYEHEKIFKLEKKVTRVDNSYHIFYFYSAIIFETDVLLGGLFLDVVANDEPAQDSLSLEPFDVYWELEKPSEVEIEDKNSTENHALLEGFLQSFCGVDSRLDFDADAEH